MSKTLQNHLCDCATSISCELDPEGTIMALIGPPKELLSAPKGLFEGQRGPKTSRRNWIGYSEIWSVSDTKTYSGAKQEPKLT